MDAENKLPEVQQAAPVPTVLAEPHVLWFHTWTRWTDLYKDNVVDHNDPKKIVGYCIIQERECVKCGLKQREMICNDLTRVWRVRS